MPISSSIPLGCILRSCLAGLQGRKTFLTDQLREDLSLETLRGILTSWNHGKTAQSSPVQWPTPFQLETGTSSAFVLTERAFHRHLRCKWLWLEKLKEAEQVLVTCRFQESS